MAPPPEYDKEPKAPDKTVTNISADDSKILYNHIKEQPTNPDHKTTTVGSNEVQQNKHVETLDDGQLRALLDEAITYKCPKDREGKSILFKNLLQEVEQDEQESEAAARGLGTGRGGRRGRGRREHHSSLQDLVAAMASEQAPRRGRTHAHSHAHTAPPAASVSARAHHGGSLPSGVDTSSLLSEDASIGCGSSRGGYLATVRCVNPPPLAERRVSAGDANPPDAALQQTAQEESLNRRNKPMFPMTYTARATLEIGSGSVCSGRAVTTTTASNQVRTVPVPTCQQRLLDALVPGGDLRGPTTNTKRKNKKYNFDEALWTESVNNWYKNFDRYAPRSIEKINVGMLDGYIKKLQIFEQSDLGNSCFVNKLDRVDEESLYIKGIPNNLEKVLCEIENNRNVSYSNKSDISLRKEYRERVGQFNSMLPTKSRVNQKNFRDMTIGKLLHDYYDSNTRKLSKESIKERKQQQQPISCQPVREICSSQDVSDNNIDTLNLEKSNSKLEKNSDSDSEAISKSPIETIANEINKELVHSLSKTNLVCESYKANQKSTAYQQVQKTCYGIPNDNIDTVNLNTPIIEVKINSGNETEVISKSQRQTVENVSDKEPVDLSGKNNLPKDAVCGIFVSKDNINAIKLDTPNNEVKKDSMNESEVISKSLSQTIENVLDIELVDFSSKTDSIGDNIKNFQKTFTCQQQDEKSCSNIALNNNIDTIKIDALNQKVEKNSGNATEVISKSKEIPEILTDIELMDFSSKTNSVSETRNFSEFVDTQQKLMEILEINNNEDCLLQGNVNINSQDNYVLHTGEEHNSKDLVSVENSKILLTKKVQGTNEKFVIAEQPNDAYIFLTLPEYVINTAFNKKQESNILKDIIKHNNTNETELIITNKKSKKKQKPVALNDRKRDVSKNVLKMLLYSDIEKSDLVKNKSNKDLEVDSAIPFSCITSPEVVASCNTTSSTSQAALTIDPKPLQLESCYRAVACLTGESALATPPFTRRSAADSDSHGPPALSTSPACQPRSVISSSFNGLPLSRPGYSSAASSNTDEYKKSLDENGNAVQGYSSPLSGSSQFKKPRRKKSTKNETVIKSHQIDGYQGNKDINEVLRFIESNAEGARGPKLRAKHKDDCDDKSTKKRSSERRKDKEPKLKRASSLEELSRTTLADLTHPAPVATATVATRRGAPPAKPERRSWGDDTRALLSDPDPAPQELTDFQTVTKKRKPRRRADDPDPDPLPRRNRVPPAPPSATPSAPPSDRSNDSNDDMDSVHSLSNAPPPPPPPPPPVPPPPPAPHASYADIARTRQNIPDLIESCNFYVENEVEQRPDSTALPASGANIPAVSTAGDAEQYPALAARRKQPAPPARVLRKERIDITHPTEPAAPAPAPDVVADRRPPVILLDSEAKPRDIDGITFGFDINEQLLIGPARRVRCDLLRDAEHAHVGEGAREASEGAVAPSVGSVAVSAGCLSLRYMPPSPPQNTAHLYQIIDYVGAAWDDVVRCVAGSGKVRYFSE